MESQTGLDEKFALPADPADPNTPPFSGEDIMTIYVQSLACFDRAANGGRSQSPHARESEVRDGVVLWRCWQRMFRLAAPEVREYVTSLGVTDSEQDWAVVVTNECLPRPSSPNKDQFDA
jgi:hypothetical protein